MVSVQVKPSYEKDDVIVVELKGNTTVRYVKFDAEYMKRLRQSSRIELGWLIYEKALVDLGA